MRKPLTCVFICILSALTYVNGYEIFYMKESGGCTNDSVEINVGSIYQNSSGILVNAFNNDFEPGLHCSILLSPPLSYGIVASIRSINLFPAVLDYSDCENYLEISPTDQNQGRSARLCGYSDDVFEFQSYRNWGGMRIIFHTSNSSRQQKAGFRLTFTAIRRGNGFCFKEERRCRNHNCIWKGLKCDGHNNCGDLSDEVDKFVSQCDGMSTGESLAVIVATIVVSLVLLIIAAYFRGPKITRQIERLRERQERIDRNSSNRNTGTDPLVPIVSRIRTNYGSISDLLSSCDYSDTIYQEPPPRYEEAQAAPPISVITTQVHVTTTQSSSIVTQAPITFPRVPLHHNSFSRDNYTNNNPHGS